MRRRSARLGSALSFALAGAIGLLSGTARGEPIPVGVARSDITPDYPVRLHGYGNRQAESKGVQQRIGVKALAIGSDEQGASVLISADVLGVTDAIASAVSDRLKREANLPRERIAFAASHTHSAPVVAGLAPNIFGKKVSEAEQEHIDRFTRDLTDALGRVALDALKARKPADLAWGQGKVGFAINRRSLQNGKWAGFGEVLGGPVDLSLPMLRATDADGKLLAVLVNYACHCTTLEPNDNLISGDWAGYAQEAIERDHPGAIALTIIGCGADANPKARTSLKSAQDHGRSLADEVNRLLRGPLKPLKTPPKGRFERVTLPLDKIPTREEFQAVVKAGGAAGYTAQTFLDRLDRGEKLPTSIDYPIQTWQFGDDLLMTFLAGEVVVDYVIRLKKELDPSRLWVVAYANDEPCYIPSERVLKEGGYEGGGAMVYYALPAPLKPGVEELIDSTVRAITPKEFLKPEGAKEAEKPGPKSPDEALRSFRVKLGFRIELVASEPLIVDPVAIDWDADSSLWVCEMHDYPSGLDGRGKPGGRIKRLVDRDGDGRFDAATTFLDGLPFPTGVMAWRKGVLVCSAPNILYAEDRDGDGKADQTSILYAGFATENFQARINGLSYHPDNWVHAANGLIGGQIRSTKTGQSVDIGGRDLRIRPDTGEVEPLSGLTQQGRVHDDWGEEFGGNNSILIQHYPFADKYARRNPFFASPSPAVYLPSDPDHTRLFPASVTIERFNQPESANRVTSACSPLIYRDTLLGREFAGNAFVCEPVHNLVHREVVSPNGITFSSHRAADEVDSEFLASTDNWSRPVQVRTGPDGALYVVDMYRQVIEHPRWISPETLAKLDVRAGDDKGRIYRIVREGAPPRRLAPLDRLNVPALAEALDDPNGTRRDMVQRLLVDRRDKAAVPVLERLATSSQRPEVRMQALRTLSGIDALQAERLRQALADPHPLVRREAVRIAEPLLSANAEIQGGVLALMSDDDLRVRYQVALSLGVWKDRRSAAALASIARSSDDRWIAAATISSSAEQPSVVLLALLQAEGEASAEVIEGVVATIADKGDVAEWRLAVETLLQDSSKDRKGRRSAALATLLEAAEDRKDLSAAIPVEALRPILDDTRKTSGDPEAPTEDRLAAIRLMAASPGGAGEAERLVELLSPRQATTIQVAAIRGLTRRPESPGIARLVAAWPGLTPPARSETIDALLSRPDRVSVLLKALSAETIRPGEIDAARRQRLANHPDPEVREAASRIFDTSGSKDRGEVLRAYRAALSTTGKADAGAKVFDRACATCHRLNGRGNEVGPDIAALTDTSPEALSIAILDPNREVDARYADYLAALADGRVVNGLIASETANAVTLKRADGKQEVVLRSQIESLTTSGRSLMPEGLEKDLTPADLADLIAFVAGATPPKSFAGNNPSPVEPGEDGVIRLPAERAAIFGKMLVFESEYRNLGYWHSDDDRAVWTFRADRPATYTVSLEYACDDGSAGNTFLLRAGEKTLRGKVGGTGGWGEYRNVFAGELTLPSGVHRLEFRASGPIQGALIDLKGIILTPRR